MACSLQIAAPREGTYVTDLRADLVTGFCGSDKRALGSRALSSRLEDMFEKTRAKGNQ